MAKRESNIVLNTIDDGEPAVQRRDDAEESTDNEPPHDEATDERTDGVANPDGSTTISATPKEPSGNSTATNMPDNPLDAEIRQFKAEYDHPEDWTDSELLAVAQQRRSPDLSNNEISERTGVTRTVVGRALRKLRHATLTDTDEIRAEFHDRTPAQQIVIAAQLAGAPDYTRSDLAEMAGCKRGSVGSTQRRFKPLIRRLDEASLPEELVPQPIRDDLTESDGTEQTTDETDDASESTDSEETVDGTDTANQNDPNPEREATERVSTNKTEPAATASRSPVEEVRQFITVLREAATKEHSLSDSPTAQQSTAARQATCEAILDYIDQRIPSE